MPEQHNQSLQLEFDFNVPFTFKDCIGKITKTNSSNDSVMQNLLYNACHNKKPFFGDWVLEELEKIAEEEEGQDNG